MKLLLQNDFTLEVGENTYTGTLSDLTKKQEKHFNDVFKSQNKKAKDLGKLVKQIKKQTRKILIAEKQEKWDDVETLETKLDTLEAKLEKDTATFETSTHVEDMYKSRIDTSIESDDIKAILSAGETYGYEKVFSTILKDVREQNEGN